MLVLFRKIKFIITHHLSRAERIAFSVLAAVFVVSFLVTLRNVVSANTITVPKVDGGYAEGIVGRPERFNPLWAPLNSQDLAITSLVYASLFEPDGSGGYKPSLAEDFSIDDKFRTWTIKLREGAKWHDSRLVTAGDVRFTIALINDPKLASPLYSSFAGVNVEEIDARTLRFTLEEGSSGFINALSYLRPMPKHLWEAIPTASIPLAEYNIKPVGSGPWRFKSLATKASGAIEVVTLERNPDFFLQAPYLRTLTIRFYDGYKEAKKAFTTGEIDGLAGMYGSEGIDTGSLEGIIHRVRLARSFAVFLNASKKPFLKEVSVRAALFSTLNREDLAQKVFKGYAESLFDPFGAVPAQGEGGEEAVRKARTALETVGWQDENNDGIYERTVTVPSPRSKQRTVKTKEDLTFKLSLPDVPEMVELAQEIREQWRAAGVGIELDVKDAAQLERDVIEPRNYEALLFGETMLQDYNPFPFWHSSQVGPGLPNLAGWQDAETDRLIQEFEGTRDKNERDVVLIRIAERLNQNYAAIFLLNPYELWWTDRDLKGVPEDVFLPNFALRLVSSADWYRETERVWRTQANETRKIN